MKQVFAGTCLAAVFAVALSAQTPQSQPPTSTPSQPPTAGTSGTEPSAQAGKDSVTLTGCIKEGDTPNSFVLANVKIDEKAGAGATGTSGAKPDKSIEGSTLKLMGSPAGTKLSEHVGHQVSVTGSISGASSSSSSPSTPPAGEPAGTAGASKGAEKSLNVKSVSMVASTCSM